MNHSIFNVSLRLNEFGTYQEIKINLQKLFHQKIQQIQKPTIKPHRHQDSNTPKLIILHNWQNLLDPLFIKNKIGCISLCADISNNKHQNTTHTTNQLPINNPLLFRNLDFQHYRSQNGYNSYKSTIQIGIESIYLQFFKQLDWMISSLWPQMLSVQPTFIWIPTFPSSTPLLQNYFSTTVENKNEELSKACKSNEGSESEHLKEPRRRTWTVEEDQKLLEIIRSMNFSDGNRILYYKVAREFKGRTSKQIRERYLNHLSTSINKEQFSKQEDQYILKYYTQSGPKWKKLSLIMSGRTPTSLKNRFNSKLKHFLTTCSNSSQQTQVKTDSSSKGCEQHLLDSRDKYSSQESS